jgi:putative DNA-invertase from lambdoid prophage Rac
MNVALYARVSTSDQDCGMQLAECREYCLRRGWKIADEYVDSGWSGRKANRPQLNRILCDAALRKFDVLIVWKIDRFGRSVLQLNENIQSLKAAGVRFIAISQGIDTGDSNPAAALLLHLLSAIAEFESEMIKERVKAGLEMAKLRGTRSGKPIGGQTKIFRRDEVIRLRDEGVPYREIARRMKIGLGTVFRTCSRTLPATVSGGLGADKGA